MTSRLIFEDPASRRAFTMLANEAAVETGGRAPGAPLVVAIHGGTYTSTYFDIPEYSLLNLCDQLRIPALAVDRPGYGGSDPVGTHVTDSGSGAEESSIIVANAAILNDLLTSLWREYGAGAPGIVLIAHSIGAAVATVIAASQRDWPLLGLAISGCLAHVPPESKEAWAALPDEEFVVIPEPIKDQVMFGAADTHSPSMPAASRPADAPCPKAELLDITGGWIDRRAQMCSRVDVPVHHRQGEFDALWITNPAELSEFAAGFDSAPSVDSRLQPGSGHCIDFHSPARAFQLSQLAFAVECAARASQSPPARSPEPAP